MRQAIDAALVALNGTAGEPSSFDALHELLEAQPYRLAYWRTASHEINYRRFFDINTLVGLRVERDEVFEATHQLLAQLIADGKVHAVRIDHPDGLFDPAKYFAMLQQLAARALGLTPLTERTEMSIASSTSSPKRFSPVPNGCHPSGPCTARPATTSSTI